MALLSNERLRWCRPSWVSCALLVSLQLFLPRAPAAESAVARDTSAEFRVKAGFLLNFPQFIVWPEQAFADEKAPIVIGLLGFDPFGTYLDELVAGERIGGRRLLVQRFRKATDITNCHILFISHSEQSAVDGILSALRGRSILTIGEDETFEQMGGMVRFTIESNRVRLRINNDAAKSAGLVLSSKLLRLAAPAQQSKR